MVIAATTQDDFPLTVGMILRHAEAVHATAPVVLADGDVVRRLTVADVAERVHRLCGALRELGVRPGEALATFAWNTQAHLEWYFAAPAVGGVLHTVNLRLAADQLVQILREAQDRVVLVDASMLDVLAEAAPRCPELELLVVCGDLADRDLAALPVAAVAYEDLLASGTPVVCDVEDERAAAAMCYTSGTTGHPKGVVYSHRSVYLHAAANLYAGGFGLSDADTVLQLVPMFHANGWGFPYAAFLSGAALVLPGRDLTPHRLVDLIADERPTVSAGVPTVWRGVYDDATARAVDVSSLRVISCAGSAVPEALIRDWVGLGVQLYQAWGMTETSPLAAIARPPADERGRGEWYWRSRTGIPVPGVEVRAVGEDGVVLPADGTSVGELEVRGPWVAGGYHAGRGADRFDDGWLRTGDVGTTDDAGAMKITDRAKDLIKSGGEWISSVQIEDLLSAVPGVADAACIGVPDEKWAERPLAIVVLREGEQPTLAQVRAHLEATLPRWQVPDRVQVVPAIVKTGVGKIDKVELRRLHAAGELGGRPLA